MDTDGKFYEGSGICYHGIPGHDSVKFDISKHFQEAAEFVKQCKGKDQWFNLLWSSSTTYS